MNLIGDVKGKHAILVDDIIDMVELCNVAQAILDAGALSVRAYITHGVLSNGLLVTKLKAVFLKNVLSQIVLNLVVLIIVKRLE